MHKSFVDLNKVPTLVKTRGRWVEESGQANEDIVLVIPGNPGLIGYYDKFLERIHDNLGYACWAVSHAGAEEPDGTVLKLPPLKGNEDLYNVKAQVQHKVEFFNKYVPEGSRVHLIGHSLGAYIILQLLKIPEVNAKVAGCYLLFPAIEQLAETPHGQFMINIMSYIYMLPVLLSYIFFYLPGFLQYILIYIYALITSMDKYFIPTTIHLVRPTILSKIFFLAFDEMDVIKELNLDVIKNNKHKIKLYYAVNDGWAPLSYCKKLLQDCPDVDAEICSRNFDHAYILRHSTASADMVSDWIRSKA